MKNTSFYATMLLGLLGIAACNSQQKKADASGTFEAIETIVAAEATGVIEGLSLDEGKTLKAGEVIGWVDSTQLFLRKQQLEAQVQAVLSKQPDVAAQLAALTVQLKQARYEQNRVKQLLAGDAATPKQMDDANTLVEVLQKQLEATRSGLSITNASLQAEVRPLQAQIAQVNDQLKRCRLINPIDGTVLVKYAEAREMTAIGKPVYKIADLSQLILRAYITGNQLPEVKVNQMVQVLTDNGKGGYHQTSGSITWISSEAEFTPKTIQTKDERANLVYAIKIKVPNANGLLKTGMYGEIKLH